MASQITIVLADDHSIIREGIKGLLELEPDFQVVAEAKDGIETIEKVQECKPDVLLLDLNMPNLSGIEALEKLHAMRKVPTTLVLTIHDEVQYLRKALELGAKGYVLKSSDFNTLTRAIRTVLNDEEFIDQKLLPVFNSINEKSPIDNIDNLTKREKQILRLIAKGLNNKEIGDELSISEKTVKNHVSNLFKKIDVTDRTQAALFAVKNGIVEL